MAHFPQTNAAVRAPRVSLRRPMSIDFRLEESGIVRGNLHVVSSTGGRAQTTKPVSGGTLVELRIGTGEGVIRGIAELLPGNQIISGWLQPFRFVALGDEDYEKLRLVLRSAIA
jgi:hypothetical protein